MEKKLETTYQSVVWRIVGAVRRKAQDIPIFRDSRNGCIRITMVPLSRDADEWLGGELSQFDLYDASHLSHDVVDTCERELIFKINSRGSYVMQYVCEDGSIDPVDCSGYSALKVAYARWKRKFDKWNRENNVLEEIEAHEFKKQTERFIPENGYSLDKGVVYTTITLDDKPFVDLYVTVSGAQTGEEDEECALPGVLEAQECFMNYKGVAKFNPYVNGKVSPLQQIWCD